MSKPVTGLTNQEGSRVSPLGALLPYLILAWILIYWSRFYLTVLAGVGAGDLDRVDLLLAVPQILWSNTFPQPSRPASALGTFLVQRIPILLHAGLILASAFAWGRGTLRGLGLHSQFHRVTRFAFAGGIGLALVATVTLCLGLSGWLSQPLCVAILLLPISLELIQILRQGRAPSQSVARSAKQGVAVRWLIAGCCLFLAPMLLGAMLPSTDFDVKEYHLQGPKEYFLAGRVQFLPHNVYTSFPFLTEMLSLTGMVLTGDWFTGALVGKVVLMAFAPISACGIFSIASKNAGSVAGATAAMCYLSTPWVYRISIIAYTEGALCCYVILSLLAFLLWRESLNLFGDEQTNSPHQKQRNLALVCGLFAGSAVATKYPGMVFVAIPMAAALLGAVILQRVHWRHAMQMATCYVLGGIITFGPWVAKNVSETGNPVYPLMYSVFGGKDLTPELDLKWKRGHARPTPLLKQPREMVQELQQTIKDVTLGSVWQSPMMFGLIPLVFLQRERRREVWLVLGAAAIMLFVWYSLTHLIDRFWVPVLPVIAVLSGIGITALRQMLLSKSSSERMFGPWAWKGVCLLWGVTLVYNFAFMTTPASGYNEYLIDYSKARQQVKPPSIQLVEQAMGESGRVLFIGEAMVFDAEFDCRYNTVFDESLLEQWTARKTGEQHWELLSKGELAQKFHKEKITHIVINWNEILRYRTTYGYTDFVSPSRISELTELWPFVEVPIPESFNLRDWEGIPEDWKREIEVWGPQLQHKSFTGQLGMQQYQLFKLAVPDSGFSTR